MGAIMKRGHWAAALGAAAVATASPAAAGVYGDDLAKCLVDATSPRDQKNFMIWMYLALSLHPDVTKYVKVTPQDREAQDKIVAGLFERLMTVDCRTQTVKALKYEGTNTIEAAFTIFGQAAARGLLSDPAVNAGMENMATQIDTSKFEALAAEAGVKP
jgi:hypothetical protein